MNPFSGYQWTLAKGNEGQTSEANLLYPIIVPSGPFMTLVIAKLHGAPFFLPSSMQLAICYEPFWDRKEMLGGNSHFCIQVGSGDWL